MYLCYRKGFREQLCICKYCRCSKKDVEKQLYPIVEEVLYVTYYFVF